MNNPIRTPIGNPISNPIGNPLGDPIGNPISNPIRNPIGDPMMLLAPLGLQLDGSGSTTFPRGTQKATKSTPKTFPGPPTKFNKQTP
jgi:hypothetical protein